jgi:hypothetical protein
MHLLRIYCFLVLGLLLSTKGHSQNLSLQGRLTDTQGMGLPYANVYVQGSSRGVTTNEQGFYSLSLPAGTHTVVFQYIGYRAETRTVMLQAGNQTLNVSLADESLTLKEVTVNAKDPDPAYAIIREAQRQRKRYLREVSSYRSMAYLKGLNRLTKAPKKILGVELELDTGVVYLSESVSELSFQQPDRIKEVMLSSKVSGDSRGFSFNQASQMNFNLYEAVIANDDFSRQGLVSPIAPDAMSYYDYQLEGVIQEGGLLLNKIRITPKRDQAPAFHGHIYIIEDSWRIHSTDIHLKKGIIDFIDSVRIQQTYMPLDNGRVWVLASQKLDFTFSVLGIVGDGYFVCLYSDYVLEPIWERRFFNNEVLRVDAQANKRDSLYWESVRPIPLTSEEQRDYLQKDSVELVKKSKPYLDSVDRANNKLTFDKALSTGYNYQNSHKDISWTVPGLSSWVQFNTVEGWLAEADVQFRKTWENKQVLRLNPRLRYSFDSPLWNASLAGSWDFAPKSFGRLSLEGGQYIEQLSRDNSIAPWVNTLYTLALQENYLKIYQKQYLKASYRQELHNGILFNTSVEYARRNPLENLENPFRLTYFRNQPYSPNTPLRPQGELLENEVFTPHSALVWSAGLRFRFRQSYLNYPDRKYLGDSKYPTLRLQYRKGLPWADSDVDYDLVIVGANQSYRLGRLGMGQWEAEAGWFWRQERLFFPDYRHFLGNQTIFRRLNFGLGDYQLLDYYAFSTDRYYLKGHWEHQLNGFFLKAIPLIRKLRLREVVGINYLYTPDLPHYFEGIIGLANIFKVIRVDYVRSYEQTRFLQQGLRVGIGF